jgi:hypothetical protein
LIFFVFGMFTAKVQGQLLPPPSFVVQPLGLSVLNGGTAIITTAAASLVIPITSVTWYYNNKPITNGSTSVLTINTGLAASSTLTIANVNSATAGEYSVKVLNSSGTTTSSNANVVIVLNTVSNLVSAVTGAVGMVSSGFKLQFSAPTGSNLVIQASSDLNNWSSISTNVVSNGSVTYTDTVARTYSSRFYRAMLK